MYQNTRKGFGAHLCLHSVVSRLPRSHSRWEGLRAQDNREKQNGAVLKWPWKGVLQAGRLPLQTTTSKFPSTLPIIPCGQ